MKRWIGLAGALGLGLLLTGCKSNCGCCGGGCKIGGRGDKMASTRPGGTPHAPTYATAPGTPQSWEHLPKHSVATSPELPAQRMSTPAALPQPVSVAEKDDPLAADSIGLPSDKPATTTSLRPSQEPVPAMPTVKGETPSDVPIHEVSSSPPESGGVVLPPPPPVGVTPPPLPAVEKMPRDVPAPEPTAPPGPSMPPPPPDLDKPVSAPKPIVAPEPSPLPSPKGEPELDLPAPPPGAPPLLPPPGN